MAIQKTKKRKMTPIRYKIFRIDASIESAQRTIESKFGLPRDSVKLVYPMEGSTIRQHCGLLAESWESRPAEPNKWLDRLANKLGASQLVAATGPSSLSSKYNERQITEN
jgi:hypothetical protein